MPEGTPPQPSPAFAGEGAKSSRLKPLLQARLAATLGKHAEPQTCPRAALRQCGKRVVAGFVEVVRERPGTLRFADPAPIKQPLHARAGAQRAQRQPQRMAAARRARSEEHTSELQSLMRISY